MAPTRTTPGSPGDIPEPRPAAARMLDVAVRRVIAEGMTVGLDHLRMEDAIKEAGISRASAYRRWPSRDDFLADVLVEVVRRTSLSPEGEEDVERLLALVARYADRLGDPQARRDLVVEALRVSVDADIRRMLALPEFRTYLSVSATYPGLPEGRVRDAVGAALARTDREFVTRRTEVYRNLTVLLGYRAVPGAAAGDGIDVLSSAAGALMTGVLIRALARPEWLDECAAAALFGSSEVAEWSQAQQHFVGLLLSHVEPDPDVAWDDEFVAGRYALMAATIERLYAETGGPLWSDDDADGRQGDAQARQGGSGGR